jgi:hypothetical protein
MSEFKRGFQVCNQVLVLRKQPITAWDQLFEPYRFFEVKTAHYVVVGGLFTENTSRTSVNPQGVLPCACGGRRSLSIGK